MKTIEPIHPGQLRAPGGRDHWAVWADDGRLVSGGQAAAIHAWEAGAGRLAASIPHGGETAVIGAAAMPPGQPILFAGDSDGALRAIDTASGETLFARRLHRRGISRIRYAAAAGLVVSAGYDGTIRFSDPADGRRRRNLLRVGQPIHGLGATGDLGLIGAAHGRGVQVWDGGGREVLQVEGYYYHGGKGQEAIAFLDNGRFACAAFRRSPELCVWDLRNPGPPAALADLFPDDIYTYPHGRVPAPQRALRMGRSAFDMAVSPDERLIALARFDDIAIVSSASCEVIAICAVPLGNQTYRSGPASALAFSPDGRRLSAASSGGIWIWAIDGADQP